MKGSQACHLEHPTLKKLSAFGNSFISKEIPVNLNLVVLNLQGNSKNHF